MSRHTDALRDPAHAFMPYPSSPVDHAAVGPLSGLISGAWVSLATSWHKHWGKLVLILLVLMHLAAIAWYSWRKRQALVAAMWHGDKVLDAPVTASADQRSTRWLAVAVWLLACATVAGVVSLGS